MPPFDFGSLFFFDKKFGFHMLGFRARLVRFIKSSLVRFVRLVKLLGYISLIGFVKLIWNDLLCYNLT